ncbi:methylase [subsurface metagenome]
MSISDEAFKKAQEYEVKHASIRYRWKDEWKRLYRKRLKDFFNIGFSFPGSVVVEIGCGAIGIISVVEAKKKVGIDPLINEHRKRYDMDKDIEYINAKGEKIPLPDDYADIVFCSNVLNHVQNPGKVLSEIARVLRPSGRLYFDVHDNPRSTGHPHVFTKNGVYQLLKRYFKVDKMIERDKIPAIGYDIRRGEIIGPRPYVSKTKVWGAICSL